MSRKQYLRPGRNSGWKARTDTLNERIKESYKVKKPCLFCGMLDNDWPDRMGLCCRCFCRFLNTKIYARKMHLDEAVQEMKAELNDPDFVKMIKEEYKRG